MKRHLGEGIAVMEIQLVLEEELTEVITVRSVSRNSYV